ncbi:MAG TPA: hypothetical protein VGB67_02445, partial [Fibrella sp.]
CFFGVIFGAVRAKARGVVINFAYSYSAFFAFIILVLLVTAGYYRFQFDYLWLSGGGAILGAMIEGVVTKFLTQFDKAPTFMAILKVIGESIMAVKDVINKAKEPPIP